MEYKRMKKLLAIAALLACTTAADARVYNYACNVPDKATGNTRLHPLKIDTAKHTITWRGATFGKLKKGTVGVVEDCAKYCFKATRSNGDVAVIETATQGVASLMITYNRPGKAPRSTSFDCDMIIDR
jgi:DNA-binding beta-propeller fold protein YncE